ncbi:MAG TPA: methyltransferase domain-containing protein [Candidatus Limnocylindrales bacterium]|nr:methyltransferase domain-containing protein [Candidatus Limnocylindrales bacterium]
MNEIDEKVNRHYGWSGLMETIEAEVRRNGIESAEVTVDELAPVDNYHWYRLAGTLALARGAAISATDLVLDVGGGIGGPARQLAHRFGCQVTVLDLTAEYCAVGETLTAWTKLVDKVSFVCGSALAMPFADDSFDVVWTQHASMNIQDKAGLYREMARVVRVGGRLAFFDVLAGPNEPIHFPVPWASDESFNFLISPEETRRLIAQSGFRELVWMTGDELDAELDRADSEADQPSSHPPLNPGLLNGSDGPRMGANVARNSAEGRILAALGVYERT